MFRNLLDVAARAVFVFGALTFSILAAFYWRERRRQGRLRARTVFAAFTLVCAVAFLDSLVFQVIGPPGVSASLALAATLIHDLTAGLLPALLLHLVWEIDADRLPASRLWKWLLAAFYVCAILPVMSGLSDGGLVSSAWGDWFYRAPAMLLAASSAAGLAMLAAAGRVDDRRHRVHRGWIGALLFLMLIGAAAILRGAGGFVVSAPDYLLLSFFCVTLYSRERLVFFDLLVKRGAFLGLGLAILTLCLAIGSSDRTAWMYAMGLLPCWLAAPWIYGRVAQTIDRVWLDRPYSPVEAERQFLHEMQMAATEDELRTHAAAVLGRIFRAPVEIGFEPAAAAARNGGGDESLAAELEGNGARLGVVRLGERANGIPFLSDDRRLLQSLARSLSLLLENVRFRADHQRREEREQELRWLAGRAELKALRAQINPHFLFNTLSVIAGLVHYRPELADETIEQLAHVFRYTLRKSENEWTPLSDEVDFVSAYLRIEQARFGERLRLRFEIDPAAGKCLIPAMSIQPIVENAIKHGIAAAEGSGTVGLRVGLDGGSLWVEVFDNGPGFPPGFRLEDAGRGHGLRNVAERLRGYYGDDARLSWGDARPGTRVMLTLPRSGRPGDGRESR